VSAAIHAQGETLASWSERIVRGADGVLMPAIVDLLAQAAAEGLVLSRVAVSTGPGGFTGLRVGVATALGVAVARGVPVVAVSSLAARAALAPGEPTVLAMLDARKSRVYAGCFDTRPVRPRALGEEQDIAPAEAMPGSPFVAVGEGALVYADAVVAAGGRVVDDAGAGSAAMVAALGVLGEPIDAGLVQLRYIRPPDAKVPRQLAGVGPARTG
jgi:tRNA threonylcarbamoyladenosine biosynthesis protein TsaB